jgi:hypothetical protein
MSSAKQQPKYRIISGATAKELAQNVNAAMADGYTPTGGVQYVVRHEHFFWVQSVVLQAALTARSTP